MQLDGRYRFDTFVVGSANRLAVAAARAVAEAPGQTHNPLFICAASGLGKTHLLGAIGNEAAARHPGVNVDAVTLDEFVRQLHAAVSVGQADTFRRRHDHADILLIDDVQLLTGRRETQIAVLHVCQTLREAGRQIVVTSDRAPGEIADVDERLLSVLASGLVVHIGAPDHDTRAALLGTWCRERRLPCSPAGLDALARLDLRSVRELQAALARVVGYRGAGAADREIDGDDVRRAFADQGGATPSIRRAEGGSASRPAAEVPAASHPPSAANHEYLNFLSDFAHAVAEHVAPPHTQPAAAAPPPAAPSPMFTRQRFAVGSSNELAVRAADAIVSEPGRRFNPLFIHGPSGVGKTHLLHAIGNGLRQATARPGIIACVGAQALIDELAAALRDNALDQWQSRYQCAAAMLVDDVHLLSGTAAMQDQLVDVFNALHTASKQVVLSGDRAPRDLTALDGRLRSAFAGGLVVEIGDPDRELRATLYARYLEQTGTPPDAALAAYLADAPAASVRDIIGVVNRLAAAADLAGTPLTLDAVRLQIEGPGAGQSAPPPAKAVPGVDPFFLDGERVVWDWPDAAGRVIEEWR